LPSEEFFPPASLPPSFLLPSIVLGCQGRYAASHSSNYLPSICHKIRPEDEDDDDDGWTDLKAAILVSSRLLRCIVLRKKKKKEEESCTPPGAKSTYPYRETTKNDDETRGDDFPTDATTITTFYRTHHKSQRN